MNDALEKTAFQSSLEPRFWILFDVFRYQLERQSRRKINGVDHFVKLVAPHPQGSDLLFWPEEGADDSLEDIVDEVERFRREKWIARFCR